MHDPGQKTLSVRLRDLEPLTTSIPTLTDLFLIPPNHGTLTCLIGITEAFEILQIHVVHPPNPSLTIHSTTSLPKGCDPVMIMPVDPMIWKTPSVEVLLSISGEGDLEFWAMDSSEEWRRTGRVKTNRKNIARARCSSTKKTVLGTPLALLEYRLLIVLQWSMARKGTKLPFGILSSLNSPAVWNIAKPTSWC